MNARDEEWNVPLHIAVKEGFKEIVEFLLGHDVKEQKNN
ncbi:ankyrin repeat domain-containing protein [Candidatus Mesenet endosymbiont of Phosphuga atrata]